MNDESFRHSDNVIVNCLGKETGIHDADYGSALACLDEVAKVRDEVVAKVLTKQLQEGAISFKQPAKIGELVANVEKTMDGYTDFYTSLRHVDNGTRFSGLFKDPVGPDTYQSRSNDFRRQLTHIMFDRPEL